MADPSWIVLRDDLIPTEALDGVSVPRMPVRIRTERLVCGPASRSPAYCKTTPLHPLLSPSGSSIESYPDGSHKPANDHDYAHESGRSTRIGQAYPRCDESGKKPRIPGNARSASLPGCARRKVGHGTNLAGPGHHKRHPH